MKRQVIYKYALSNINLRDGKSTDAGIITVIPKMGKMELLDAEEDWLKVRYENNEGYVYNANVSKTFRPFENVNLRSRPTVNSESITVIPKKTPVQVISVDGDWSRVIYDNKMGFVYRYYLSQDGNKPTDINYRYFGSDMTRFVYDNNFQSKTNYLLITDLKDKYTYVFKKEGGKWVQLYKYLSTVGKPSTPTIKGTFAITGRKPYFGTDKYRVKYATRIIGGYYYHSILFDRAGAYVIDSRLGQALSHGCIRLALDNAKWIYDNIPDGTTVFIN